MLLSMKIMEFIGLSTVVAFFWMLVCVPAFLAVLAIAAADRLRRNPDPA